MLGTCDTCGDPATHECDAPDCGRKMCDGHTTWWLPDAVAAAGGDVLALQDERPQTYCPLHAFLAEISDVAAAR